MSATAPIEIMDLQGAEQTLAWAEAEGWEPGRQDALAFFAADPQGFFRSTIDGETIATISVVRGSERVAFVGLYIVDPELRGRGFGKALWDAVISRFGEFTLGLDAVPEQVATYATDGFLPAYGNVRYSIDAGLLPGTDRELEVKRADAVPFDDLVEFDAARFFGPRPGFLRRWITGPGREAVIASEDGVLTGFAASRASAGGHRIGPVFAEVPGVARELILTLADRVTGSVSIDVPEPNMDSVQLLESLGMERGFATTRMYRGPAPELPLEEVFGITSLELG